MRSRRVVWSVRPLSASELAALNPLSALSALPEIAALAAAARPLSITLVPVSNLRRMPATAHVIRVHRAAAPRS